MVNTELSRNTFTLTLASIGQKLIAFVYFVMVARVMQPEQTGMYFLAISLAMIFSVIADIGITPVVIREIAKNPENTHTLFRRALALKIPFLLIGYLCAVGSSILLGYSTQIVIFTSVAGLSIILDSLHLLFYGVLRGHQRLGIESMGMMIGQLLVASVGGLILWLAPSLFLLLFALVAGSFFQILFSGIVIVRRFGKSLLRPIWDKRFIPTLFKMAFPFALSAIFVKIYSSVDTIFLSKFLDIAAVGLYSIAYKFTYAFQFLPLSFTAALYPKFSWSLVHQPDDLPRLFRRSLWYMLLLSTPLVLGLHLLALPAVLLVGSSYKEAAPVLSVLVFVLVPIFLDFPIGSLLNAAGRQMTKTTIIGITMIVNVILNAILIPRWGILGAAYASLASFLFLFCVGFVFVPRIIPAFQVRLFILDALKIGLSGALMFAIGKMFLSSIGWIATIPLCAIVYFVGLVISRAITRKDLIKLKRLFAYGS